MLTSKHSKIQLGEDGEVVELWSFEESLPSHVRFVEAEHGSGGQE